MVAIRPELPMIMERSEPRALPEGPGSARPREVVIHDEGTAGYWPHAAPVRRVLGVTEPILPTIDETCVATLPGVALVQQSGWIAKVNEYP